MPNQWICYFTLLAIAGVPFYFRRWATSREHITPDELDAKVSRLTLILYACLFFFCTLNGVESNSSQSLPTERFSEAGFAITILSFAFLYSFRAQRSAEVQKKEYSPRKNFMQSARKTGAMLLLIGSMLLIGKVLTPFLGSILSYACSVIFVVYSAPLFVRVMWDTHKMEASPLRDQIESVFHKAHSPIKHIFLIDNTHTKMANALICGPKWGFGPIGRCLFLTENLFTLLSEEEITAVVSHEASHFRLHHVAKRAVYAIAISLFCMVVMGIPCGILMPALHSALALSLLTGFVCVASIALQFNLIGALIKQQEFEADLAAVDLGASAEHLISALEKLTRLNGASSKKVDAITKHVMGKFHPSLDERKECLLSGVKPKEKTSAFKLPAIVSYSAIVVAISIYSYANHDAKTASHSLGKDFPFRTPASVPKGN